MEEADSQGGGRCQWSTQTAEYDSEKGVTWHDTTCHVKDRLVETLGEG